MKQLKYSPDSIEKLKEIKREIATQYGLKIANRIISKMMKSIRDLQHFENKGQSVEGLTGISCDYRFLYVQHNYVFYRVENDTVWITDIYNEKEDFMWKLFGIRTTDPETEDYWGE